jgi:ligand-binding sensor domain-containing protein
MNSIKLLILIPLICSINILIAQNMESEQSIGITNIVILEIANNGDIWAGSSTDGLAFYNDSIAQWSLLNISNTPALKSNVITSLAITPIGGIKHSTIGTSNGACVTQPSPIPWDTIASVDGLQIRGVSYRPDSVWILTPGTITRLDSSYNFIQNYSAPFPSTTSMESGQKQCAGFWTGTANNGCYYTSNGTSFLYIDTSVQNKMLIDNRVVDIAVDISCERIFVGTKAGFSACPTNFGPPCLNYTPANGLPQDSITTVEVACNGNVWIGTRDSGIVIYNPQTQQFSRFTKADGLVDNRVSVLSNSGGCTIYAGSPNGDITLIDSNMNVVKVMNGIRSIKYNEYALSVFPNPTKSNLNFVLESDLKDAEIIIADIKGRKMIQQNFSGNRTNIDVSFLSEGLYFYQLYSKNKLLKNGRISISEH